MLAASSKDPMSIQEDILGGETGGEGGGAA